MSEAIDVVYYIFNKFIDFLFNQAYILQGVSLGWILIIVSIMLILFSGILNQPTGYMHYKDYLDSKNERVRKSELRHSNRVSKVRHRKGGY